MQASFLVVCLLALCSFDISFGDDGVLGKITSGFKIAGKFLGLDHANDVAQLVSEAFGKANRRGDVKDNGNNIFSGFLRILGFDTKKIGAIAVNAVIFVAQLISTTLSKNQPSQLPEARKLNDEKPLEWMLKNSQVSKLMSYVQDNALANHVIEYIKENSLDEETDCIQLLICKMKPFINRMQMALSERKNQGGKTGKAALFEFLPSIEEVVLVGDKCEERHPYCLLFY